MRLKYYLIIFVTAILSGCTNKDSSIAVNSYVESFTNGVISDYGSVTINFTDTIPASYRNNIKDCISITPNADLSITISDNNSSVTIKPVKSFKSGTKYKVDVNIASLFGVDTSPFDFGFSTQKEAASLSIDKVLVKNKEAFIKATIFTNDKRDESSVESSISLSESYPITWEHSNDGINHSFTAGPINNKGTDKITIKINKNSIGLDRKEESVVTIPTVNDMNLLSIRNISSPERFIELVFSSEVDPSQDIRGLIDIKGVSSFVNMSVVDNSIKIYIDGNTTTADKLTININKALSSRSGVRLNSDIQEEVYILPSKPMLKFANNSSILPLTDSVNIPFQAINLRAARVKIFRLYRDNVNSFLQNSNIDGYVNLSSLAFPVACKTMLFDEIAGFKPDKWNTYNIDIKQLAEVEPGAIYYVEISIDKRFAVYSECSTDSNLSATELAKEDKKIFEQDKNTFENGEYYDPNSNFNWSTYNWNQRSNPCSPSYYIDKTITKNILATDLAIIAKSGFDGKVSLMVNNISSAHPEQGVVTTLYNYQNQPISTGQTSHKGEIWLDYGASKPLYVIATKGRQYSYLRLDNVSELSLSNFDVWGENVQKGIQGFIYGDRDVYRPGDTITMTLIVRDIMKKIPDNHPVNFTISNPIGQTYKDVNVNGVNGFYRFVIPTSADVMTGKWIVSASIGGVVFSKTVHVETIKPNRIKIQLSSNDMLVRGDNMMFLKTSWLTGAVSSDLKYSVEANFSSTKTTFQGYDNYVFDSPLAKFNSNTIEIAAGKTNDKGDAVINANLNIGYGAPGMLGVSLLTRVYENSGEYSVNNISDIYSPYESYVGIKKPESDHFYYDTDKNIIFDVVSLSQNGKVESSNNVLITVYKTSYSWWWNSNGDNSMRYISEIYNNIVSSKSYTTDSNGKVAFNMSVPSISWGNYYIEVKDISSGHKTGVMAFFDSYSEQTDRNMSIGDKPMVLMLKSDKEKYNLYDQATVSFPAIKGAQAIISIEKGGQVLKIDRITCSDTQESYTFKIGDDMLPNVYVYVSLIQPYSKVFNDMPIRLYGVIPIMAESADTHLEPIITSPQEASPDKSFEIEVSEEKGRQMTYTIAVVDEGLLGITNYKTPNPWNIFYARGALGVSTWDSYNFIFGAYAGKIEQSYSIGGDAAIIKRDQNSVNRFKPVAINMGAFTLKARSKQKHTIKIPNYIGDVRVMVVAASETASGSANKNIKVFNPVMVLPTLPRSLSSGDIFYAGATVFAMKDKIGKIKVSSAVRGDAELLEDAVKEITLNTKSDTTVYFKMKAVKQGVATVTMKAESGNNVSVMSNNIQVNSTDVVRSVSLFKNITKSFEDKITLPGIASSNKVKIELSGVPPIGAASRIEYLTTYPYACVEQIVSSAFPLLYINSLTKSTERQSKMYNDKVQSVISRLVAYQNGDGSLSYWPSGGETSAWGSIYAANFLIEATNRGYDVPNFLINSLINNISENAQKWNCTPSPEAVNSALLQSYRLYVLSLYSRGLMGSMNRLKECGYMNITAKALLSMAYVVEGRKDIAASLLDGNNDKEYSNNSYVTFASEQRDMSILLMSNIMLGNDKNSTMLLREISKDLSSDMALSTQSTSFALIAVAKYYDRFGFGNSMSYDMTIDGVEYNADNATNIVSLSPNVGKNKSIDISITNKLSSPLFLNMSATGMANDTMQKASSNGLSISTVYVNKDGGEINVRDMEQSRDFLAITTINNLTAGNINNLVLVQPIASGWEISNMFYSMGKQSNISYVDVRDTQVNYFIDVLSTGGSIVIKTPLTTTYKGIFFMPSTHIEAMYSPDINANTPSMKVTVK